MKQAGRRTCAVAALASVAILVAGAQAAVPLTQIITDTFTNVSSQHRTAVEPDTFAFGSRMVTVAQVGRFFNGGASGIGFATTDGSGNVLASGVLPGITFQNGNGGSYERVSDPSIAYNARYDVWLASTLPLTVGVSAPEVLTSRSTDGGLTWGNPIQVVHGRIPGGPDLDKNWIACDNTPTSPFYGNCYTTYDDFGDGNRLYVSTSRDGGLTWDAPQQTANGAGGLGGQPVVQPNGTVIIPAANAFETAIIAFRSTDGGATWSSPVAVASIIDHLVAGNLRSPPLPSAEIDAAGRVYLVWQDCRFRAGCAANDIVMSTSIDGVSWSHVTRIPIDGTGSGVDHFIPGIGVDPSTSGSTAKLGLTYYLYRSANCGGAHGPCQLEVGYVHSNDGGGTWSHPADVAGPFGVNLIADTSQGRMVGDYISTSWLGGKAFGAFAVARPPSGAAFDETIEIPTGGLAPAGGAFASSAGEQPVPGAASDYAKPTAPVRVR